MDYTDAIVWLKENNVTKEDGTSYEFGDVSLYACTLHSVIGIQNKCIQINSNEKLMYVNYTFFYVVFF